MQIVNSRSLHHLFVSLPDDLFRRQLAIVRAKNHHFLFMVPRYILNLFCLGIGFENLFHESADPFTLDVYYFFEIFKIGDHTIDVDFRRKKLNLK